MLWVKVLCVSVLCYPFACAVTDLSKCSVDSFGHLQGCNTPQNLAYSMFSTAAVGANHICAIRLPLRDVLCWPEENQAARHPSFIRDATALSLGMDHSCAVWGVKKTLTCWGEGVVEQAVVNVTQGVRMLAVGDPTSKHTCFLRESNNDISCIGDNNNGQLGLGDGTEKSWGFGFSVANVRADFIRRD
jgi:hypothetical protein